MQASTISTSLSLGTGAVFNSSLKIGALMAPGMWPPLNSAGLRGSMITGALFDEIR
jgi:hypothetical protein